MANDYNEHDLERATQMGAVTATLKEHGVQLDIIFQGQKTIFTDIHQIKNELTKIGALTMLIEAYKTNSETLNNLVLKVAGHETAVQDQGKSINALMSGVRKLEAQEWKRAGFYLAINIAIVITPIIISWLKG